MGLDPDQGLNFPVCFIPPSTIAPEPLRWPWRCGAHDSGKLFRVPSVSLTSRPPLAGWRWKHP